MSAIKVFQNIRPVSSMRIREDILDTPISFFPGFRNFLTSPSFYHGEEEEIAFFGNKGVLFFVKILESPEDTSIDQLLEDILLFQGRWQRFRRQQQSQSEEATIFEVILFVTRAEGSFLNKISFIKGVSIQVYLLKGIEEGGGRFAYFMEKIFPLENSQSKAYKEADLSRLNSSQLSSAEHIDSLEHELSEGYQQALSMPASKVAGVRAENHAAFAERSGKNFFVKGKLTPKEEEDFDALHYNLSLKHKAK